jgi:hypothetical protein
VDNQGWIIASCVSESHEQDPSQVPELLSQVDPPIHCFVGDGMYAPGHMKVNTFGKPDLPTLLAMKLD